MTGTLFVLPVPLTDGDPEAVLPPPVLKIARERSVRFSRKNAIASASAPQWIAAKLAKNLPAALKNESKLLPSEVAANSA